MNTVFFFIKLLTTIKDYLKIQTVNANKFKLQIDIKIQQKTRFRVKHKQQQKQKEENPSPGIYLLSDQRKDAVTSCKCVCLNGADRLRAAASPDRMQH